MGLSVGRSWSRLDAFEGNCLQKLTNLLKIDFSNTPTKGLAWMGDDEAEAWFASTEAPPTRIREENTLLIYEQDKVQTRIRREYP